jgi:hypothetical protein
MLWNHILNFIAVILGVLMAFYISDSAELKAERRESNQLKKALISDLSADIKAYEDYQIPINEEQLKEVDSILLCLIEEDLEGTSEKLGALFQIENYVPTKSTFISMNSSGKLELIRDIKLRRALSDFYDGVAVESEEKSQVQVDFFLEDLLQWLMTHTDFTTMEFTDTNNMVVFRNKLIIYRSFIEQKTKEYRRVLVQSKTLRVKLEKSVKKS